MKPKGSVGIAALLLVVTFVVPTAFGQGAAVSVDSITGVWWDVNGLVGPAGTGYIMDGLVIYHIRITNNTGGNIMGFTNGFRIYSPDGATWDTTRVRFAPAINPDWFDCVFSAEGFDVDGQGEDRVGFSASVMMGSGLPSGFNNIGLQIEIGPTPDSTYYKTICLDSCYFPPSGLWLWAPGGVPTWDGPYCFAGLRLPCVPVYDDGDGVSDADNCDCVSNQDQADSDWDGIGDACDYERCCHRKADINYDGQGPDIADLVAMVNFMFNEGYLACDLNADLNDSGWPIDISDLVYMVDYMFNGGPEPVPCPSEPMDCFPNGEMECQ